MATLSQQLSHFKTYRCTKLRKTKPPEPALAGWNVFFQILTCTLWIWELSMCVRWYLGGLRSTSQTMLEVLLSCNHSGFQCFQHSYYHNILASLSSSSPFHPLKIFSCQILAKCICFTQPTSSTYNICCSPAPCQIRETNLYAVIKMLPSWQLVYRTVMRQETELIRAYAPTRLSAMCTT